MDKLLLQFVKMHHIKNFGTTEEQEILDPIIDTIKEPWVDEYIANITPSE